MIYQKSTHNKEVKTAEVDENLINLNPASNVKQTVYTYDANGNQITKTADGKTETNTYDGLNQLIGFNDGETTASYKYNASGLRYEKTVDGETINHVWDGNQQIVADVVDNQFYEADCYIRGTNLVAKYNYRNGNKSEYTYYTQNAHGDVVNLTNADGEVTKKYTYDAFGVEKNIDDSDTNAFRYCGEYFDKETATVYLRARYYDPEIGRFISRDSFAGKNEDPLSLNRYTYCHNNPLLFVDLDGHKTYDLGKGWEVRIENAHGNNNDKGQHVHLSYKNGKKTYSQNDDGSPHDKNNNSPGSPPSKVLKTLKEKTGWDWKKNEEKFLSKAEYDYCGTVSKPYYQLYDVYQVTYADETIRFTYESPFNEFSPSTNKLKDIYEDGMTSNPIQGNQNENTSSVIIGPMPYSGPVYIPSFNFFPVPALLFQLESLNHEVF